MKQILKLLNFLNLWSYDYEFLFREYVKTMLFNTAAISHTECLGFGWSA